MLNYIKAELWKAFRHKGIYGLTVFLGLCTALFTGLMLAAEDFAQMASAATTTMLLGMLVAPLLTQTVDGGTLSTLKNEVSFGLSRSRIYLGKLLTGLALGLGLCLLLMGSYLAVGWVALPHSSQETDMVALGVVGFFPAGRHSSVVRRIRAVPHDGYAAAQYGRLDGNLLPAQLFWPAHFGIVGRNGQRRPPEQLSPGGDHAHVPADAGFSVRLADLGVPVLVLDCGYGMAGGYYAAGAVLVPQTGDQMKYGKGRPCRPPFWAGKEEAACG